MIYLYLLIAFLFLIFLALIIYIIYKLKKSSSENIPTVWSGNCNYSINSECDLNNNCSVSCNNKILFSSKNQCGKLSNKCENGVCSAFCVNPPNPILKCKNGFGIWQGKCSSVPSVTTSNRNVTIKCDNDEIISRALCDSTSVSCTNGQCVVCCKVDDPPPEPPPPTCPEGANKVWPASGAEKCPFIQTQTINEKSKLFCSGKEVFSGNCGEISTLCTNGKCIGCCTSANIRAPPTCLSGTEVWRTDDPSFCSSINTSCENGTCIASCNGRQIYKDSSGYTNIINFCNNVGCVICAL